jgi:hypothetical protein
MNFIRDLFYIKQVNQFSYRNDVESKHYYLTHDGGFNECEKIINDPNTYMMQIETSWQHRLSRHQLCTYLFDYDKNLDNEEKVRLVKNQIKCFKKNHTYRGYRKCVYKIPLKCDNDDYIKY